jgi:hypothetical protein
VYISRDVVFDETIFPFEHLHDNAGVLLWKEILLLPHHLLNPGCGDESCSDQSSGATNTSGSASMQEQMNSDTGSGGSSGIFPSLSGDPNHPTTDNPSAGSGTNSEADTHAVPASVTPASAVSASPGMSATPRSPRGQVTTAAGSTPTASALLAASPTASRQSQQ